MDTTFFRRATAIAALTLLGSVLAACSDSSENSTKATKTVVLKLGTDDAPDAPAGEQIEHFAAEVAKLSDGTVKVKPVWHAAGEGVEHWDQAIAELVMDGELDLAVVPTRAWDALGVSTLTALNTPFLVTSDALVEEIVTGDLAMELMSGLPDVGVHGLAMFPEGLRHPFGFGDPLRSLDDYTGGVFRTPYSKTTTAMFQALGGLATEADVDPTSQRGAESSYRLVPTGIATGNVIFYPKVNSLVLNDGLRKELRSDQVRMLQRAADATQKWVIETLPSDNESAKTFCSEAGRIVAATEAQLKGVRAAIKPVVAALRGDQHTADLIDRIQALNTSIESEVPVTSCNSKADNKEASAVNGVYQTTITADALTAAGVKTQDMIDENVGRYTITLKDGGWSLTQVYTSGPKNGETWNGTGSYTLKAHRLTWHWSHQPGDHAESDVKVESDGSLRFSNHVFALGAEELAMSTVQFSHWERTGDAP